MTRRIYVPYSILANSLASMRARCVAVGGEASSGGGGVGGAGRATRGVGRLRAASSSARLASSAS